MKPLEILYETPTKIVLTVNNLAANDKTFSDITDVLYMLKKRASDSDESALVTKDYKTANGVSLVNETIEIFIGRTDFSKLTGGETYLVCFSIEFDDNGIYIEDEDPNFTRNVKIMKDKTRR